MSAARLHSPAFNAPAMTWFDGVGDGRSGARSGVSACSRQSPSAQAIGCLAPWILIALLSPPSYSQFLPDLQARTPAEYDAYLDALDGPVIDKGAAFLRSYPESALRLPVHEFMTRAFRRQADAARAIDAASAGLAIAPDYIPLLVELADLLANGSTGLTRAETAARRALTLLETAKAPRRIAPGTWTEALAGLRARSHAALGLVHFQRDDLAGAIREFEAALAHRSSESPAVHYRLGRLHASAGRRAEARRHLREAERTGDPALRELAGIALREIAE